MWLARHTPEKVLPILHKVITSVKEEFADAVANGGGIYAVGYCFGARYVLLLGSKTGGTELLVQPPASSGGEQREAEEGLIKDGPLIKTGAIAHATQVDKEQMAGITVPVCVVAVENDPLFPDEEREAGLKSLQESGLEYESEIYQAPHGFAVYADYADETIVEKQGDAFQRMLRFLKNH